VNFWSETKSLTSSPPKSFSLVEQVVMASLVIRSTIHPSEKRLLVSLAQQFIENSESDSTTDAIAQVATALAMSRLLLDSSKGRALTT
jgi:hypothetical protein